MLYKKEYYIMYKIYMQKYVYNFFCMTFIFQEEEERQEGEEADQRGGKG